MKGMMISAYICSNCKIIKTKDRALKYQCAMITPYMDMEEPCKGVVSSERCGEYDPICVDEDQ